MACTLWRAPDRYLCAAWYVGGVLDFVVAGSGSTWHVIHVSAVTD
jgi:hypothetical protein